MQHLDYRPSLTSNSQLRFHPSSPHVLLSGSTDGLVNIYDTRVADEDEVILQTFNHDASIHRAGFLSADEVFALSHDERLALYSCDPGFEHGAAATDFGDAREVIGCRYVANVVAKTDGLGAIIGAGSQE